MKQLFANNATTTLATSLGVFDSILYVATGTGGLFPNPVVGKEYFLVTLELAGTIEIVRCTSRTNDALTIDTRGMEGTIAASFAAGAAVECRTTATTLSSMAKKEERLYELASVDLLTAPSTMDGNSYICHSNDDDGNPVIALKDTDTLWRFTTHSKTYISGSVTAGTNTTTQLTSTSISTLLGGLASGQFILQFTAGQFAGTVRAITGTGTNTITWSTPLSGTPVVTTDQFKIYKSDISYMTGADPSVYLDESIMYSVFFS